MAHESSISGLGIAKDGSLCAASSEDGRYIRIINVATGSVIQQFYNGPTKTIIQDLIFDESNDWVACSTDKDIVSVFSIKKHTIVYKHKKEPMQDYNSEYIEQHSSCFASETSFAEFRIPHPDSKVALGFIKSQVIIVTRGGYYYRVKFDKETGGSCKLIEEKSIYNDN